MAARTTKTALAVGIVYGGLQDVAGMIRGRPIGYVDFVKKHLGPVFRGSSSSSSSDDNAQAKQSTSS